VRFTLISTHANAKFRQTGVCINVGGVYALKLIYPKILEKKLFK